jgi:hypothetical protein
MPRAYIVSVLACASAVVIIFAFAPAASGQTVWTGPGLTFSKDGADDVNLPASQDRMTDNVWLTRGFSEGMFNIAPGKEAGYVRFTSPADTKWATAAMTANTGKTIAANNWPQLAFIDWAPAYGGPGSALASNITTRNAVVHLVTDNIYLDLMFTEFDSGGNFAYQRSTPALTPPSGDYNHNGIVDGADYVVWRDTLNQSAAPQGSGADGNANGTVDAGDYSYWRERFGNIIGGSGAGAVALVPEPAAIVLPLTGLLSFWPLRARLGS